MAQLEKITMGRPDTADHTIKIEASISFAHEDFVLLGTDGFHPSQVNTMPVVHFENGAPRPLGTCFVINSEGLALTARHVIDEAFGKYSQEGREEINIPAHEGLAAIYMSNEVNAETGHYVGGPLPVQKIWTNGGMDIAVLQLSVPTNVATGEKLYLPAAILSPGLPKMDDFIFGFGYHNMNWESAAHGANADHRYAATRGTVKQLHFPKRDNVFMSFPCFETSARFDGGMSGGPLISMSGQVCGVICSSMKTAENDGTFTSYASLIGPALALVIEGRDTTGRVRPMFLHQFVKDGGIAVDDTFKSISVADSENEIEVKYENGWSFRNSIRTS